MHHHRLSNITASATPVTPTSSDHGTFSPTTAASRMKTLLVLAAIGCSTLLTGCYVYEEGGYYGHPGGYYTGNPYYYYGGVPYYSYGGRYYYYRNHQRYYVNTLPRGGSYYSHGSVAHRSSYAHTSSVQRTTRYQQQTNVHQTRNTQHVSVQKGGASAQGTRQAPAKGKAQPQQKDKKKDAATR